MRDRDAAFLAFVTRVTSFLATRRSNLTMNAAAVAHVGAGLVALAAGVGAGDGRGGTDAFGAVAGSSTAAAFTTRNDGAAVTRTLAGAAILAGVAVAVAAADHQAVVPLIVLLTCPLANRRASDL